MVRLFLILIITCICQIALSQVNLNLDIDARQLTPMKLSDISEESRYVALKMGGIFDYFVTDKLYLYPLGLKGRFTETNGFNMTYQVN